MRTALKWTGILLAATVVVAAVFLVNLLAFRPFSLNLFYEKVFLQFALANPETLTQYGLLEQYGYRRHNAHLDDLSPEKSERDARFWRRNLQLLKGYDYGDQTPDQQLSTRVLAWYMQDQVDGERFRFHDYPVNQMEGVPSQTVDFLINQHQIQDRRGAEDFIARLGEVPRKFAQLKRQLELREERGIVPPRFVLERVLTEMRAFEARYVRDNPLYVHCAERVAALPDARDDERNNFLAWCADAVENRVRPAFRELIGYLDDQLQRATTDDGVWKLPEGDAYYAWRLRSETTTDLTPQQVHELGLGEVARIDLQMRAILASQGELRAGETAALALARLGKEARFLYPDDDVGREAALAEYRRLIEEQLQRSTAFIGLRPRSPIEVKRVPQFMEANMAGAYYTIPALDGSRPGVFWANLRDMGAVPTFGMRTLAIHEGVPGHHFQIALAQEVEGGPTFRKVIPFTAYSEGWALYAEALGKEMGLYANDPWGDLGRLQAEMFRAVRLVVDTGIHYRRWTREEAILYMRERTGMAEGEVVAEIERYIVLPGQACSYKIGMLRIEAARRRAEAALGPRFDAEARKAFHDVVLGEGALPLEVLDEQVDAWIRGRVSG
jgi:uncharacterized protein (DUF885 family)